MIETVFRLAAALFAAASLPAASLPAATASLERLFEQPPAEAQPGVFWPWIAGNVTREGITRDLEWMRANRLRRATIFHLGENLGGDLAPSGPVVFNSPEWHAMMRHAAAEAERLGITLGMHNADGWGTAGGPWIEPKDAMKQLTFGRVRVTGGGRNEISLPQPPMKKDYYQDIALLAYPAKRPEKLRMHEIPHKLRWLSPDGREVDIGNPAETWPQAVHWRDYGVKKTRPLSALTDRNRLTDALLPTPPTRKRETHLDSPVVADAGTLGSLEIRFERPIPARSAVLYPFEHRIEWYSPQRRGTMRIEAKGKDGTWRELARAPVGLDLHPSTASFPETRSDAFRISFLEDFRPSKRWMWWWAFSEIEILGPGEESLVEPRIKDLDAKAAMIASMALPRPSPPAPAEEVLKRQDIVDLTDLLAPGEAAVAWEAPPGEWTLLRIGYTVSGKTNHPPTDAGRGLECDKLHPSGVEAHWRGFLRPLLEGLRPYTGGSFARIESDSWEAGAQNWTRGLEGAFEKRHGYSIVPYLPIVAGEVVESAEAADQVLRDWRMLLSEMIAENFYGRFAELCASVGVTFEAEMAGAQAALSDPIANAHAVHAPMTEFWTFDAKEFSLLPIHDRRGALDAISGAHLSGKFEVAAEAFTSGRAHFLHEPATLKPSADAGFSAGLNYYYHHASAHQPDETMPGWNMDPWGIVFNRKLTWADEALAWNTYLARCQALLREGRPVVDILYLKEESDTNFLGREPDAPFGAESHPFPGYKFHSLSPRLLHRLDVVEGRIATPEGMAYEVLYTPGREAYSMATLRHLKRLKDAGARIVGEAPERALGKRPDADAADELIRAVWSGLRSEATSPKEAIEAVGLTPAMTFASPDENPFLNFTHRRVENADLFFVFNQRDRRTRAELSFRVKGKIPEIWRPDAGERFRAGSYSEEGGRTTVPLAFDAYDSVFVVLRDPADAAAPIRAGYGKAPWPKASGRPNRLGVEKALTGPWTLTFEPAIGPAPRSARIETLRSWSDFEDSAIRHFAGKGIYRAQFEWTASRSPGPLYLDLGDVKNIARVELNGRDMGVLWKPPFIVPINSALREGTNSLKVTVTNLWPNRLIREAATPDPFKVAWTNNDDQWSAQDELLPSGLLGPVRILGEALSLQNR